MSTAPENTWSPDKCQQVIQKDLNQPFDFSEEKRDNVDDVQVPDECFLSDEFLSDGATEDLMFVAFFTITRIHKICVFDGV